MNRLILPVTLATLLTTICAVNLAAQDKITFDDHAKPIFKQRCIKCHNPDKASGGLDLSNYTNLMQGGSSGSSIEPGDAGDSYLYMLVTHDEEPSMPPGGSKIPDGEIQMLAKWIDGGALESITSVARIAKPKITMAAGTNPNVRPEIVPMPARMSLEPAIRTARPGNATAIATSPWAPVAAIGMARQVLLYNTTNLQLIGVLPFPEGQVYKLKFSRNGDILIAGGGKDGANGVVVGWSIRSGERVFSVGDEMDAVMAADISTDHSKVALGGPSKMIRVYSTTDGSLLYEIKKHTGWLTAIEFSPDGVLFATGDRNGGLHIWEAETGNEYLTLKGHTKQIAAVSWRYDGNLLASTSEDTTTRLWEMENGNQVKQWGSHGGGSTSVDFTRDGNILTTGRDKVVKLWKQDGAAIHQFGGLADISIACAFCDETGRVIGSDWSGMLRVWNGADKSHLGDITTNPATLQERIQGADTYLQKVTGEFTPVQTAFQTTNERFVSLTANLTTTAQGLQASQAELKTTQDSIATHNKQLEEINITLSGVQEQLKNKSVALPLVKESLAKSAEAAKALPDDAALQATTNQLTEKVKVLSVEVTALQSQVESLQQDLSGVQTKVTEIKTLMGQQQSKVDETTKQANELQSQKAGMETKLAELKTQFDASQNSVNAAQASAKKWQSEMEFATHLKTLYDQLGSASDEYSSEAERVAVANQKVVDAQAELDKVKSVENEAMQKVEGIQQEILKARGIGN